MQFLTNVNTNIPALMAQGTISAFLSAPTGRADLPHLSPLIRQSNSLSMPAADLLWRTKEPLWMAEERSFVCAEVKFFDHIMHARPMPLPVCVCIE